MTQAIFLGAGRGSRLQQAAGQRPKWLLKVAGQSIAQHAVNVMHGCGVTTTLVVRGALGGTVLSPSVAYLDAPGTQNMVETLFAARDYVRGDVIFSYCDIMYEPRVVEALLGSSGSIGVVVDKCWRSLFSLRADDPLSIAERCRLFNDKIVELGQPLAAGEQPDAQYIGLMRFSETAFSSLAAHYDVLLATYSGKPWRNAPTFEQAYLTDFLQEVIDRGYEVEGVPIEGGWLEFDTQRDLSFAQTMASASEHREVFDFSALPPRPSVLSAGGVAVRDEGERREVLLVGSGLDGEWRIPKGMLEPGEPVASAARREVAEETGTAVEIERALGVSDWIYWFGGVEWSEHCFFHRMRAVSLELPKPDAEHGAAAWLPAGQALGAMMYDNERCMLEAALA